jgi:hypothetical protein
MEVPDLAAQQQQLPPKQIGFPPPPVMHLEVAPAGPGHVMLKMLDRQRNELYAIPMTTGYARELGNELIAPNVVPANGNGTPPA